MLVFNVASSANERKLIPCRGKALLDFIEAFSESPIAHQLASEECG
jgi:hypothetical protein